jgi:hypothetical protein
MRQALLVLDMHRSGTSALKRGLSLLSTVLPNNPPGRTLGNETGHSERKHHIFRTEA